jgi:nucleotide-binding universal stress UspA family protein
LRTSPLPRAFSFHTARKIRGLPPMLYSGLNSHMIALDNRAHLKLDNILVATDFSSASKMALLYALSIARRHSSKLFVVHVSSSQSEGTLMDAWRAGQTEIMDHFMAGRLTGVQHQLLVKSGDVWTVLSQLIAEYGIDLVVLGTRGRTGVWKLLLGSVAERIFRQAPCPVLTAGPSISGQDPETGPQRILVPTGFAPQSLNAVGYALWLAQELHSSLALLHVVTDPSTQDQERIRSERLARLHALIRSDEQLPSWPEFFVEFGSAPEKILETAARWNPNLIVLGLHHIDEALRTETTWAKAYEIVCKANCPVLTVRAPE